MDFEFLIDNKLHKISLEKKEDCFVFSDGEKTQEVNIQSISAHVISVLIEGHSYQVYWAKDKERRYLFLEGEEIVVQEPTTSQEGIEKREEKSREDELIVRAPMPGKVIKINVSENERVRKNQTLAIVEAMKMENELKSTVDGYVKKIHISPGELVDSEKPLIELGLKD